MSDLNNQGADVNAKEQAIPPVSGKPTVTGKRGKNRAGAIFLGLLALSVLIGGLFLYYALGNKDAIAEKADNGPKVSITSSKELTLPPIPPEPPKPKEEPKKEEPKPIVIEKPVEIAPMPAPIPTAPVSQGNFDANGDPIPTLEELKYAAPMMGQMDRQGQVSSASAPSATNSADLYDSTSSEGRDLSQRLKSVPTPKTDASLIKDQSLLLSKGTVIECILESRVDTTVPGMTTCVIPRDIYSMNGRVLLVEKGTRAIGEYQGSVANGLARIFMLWTELRTPHGVSIQLNSPAADALGGAGMGGYVDFHWFKRFGNALMFSLVADAFQYGINTANSNNNNGDITYENSENGMSEIIKEAMAQSGNIPPTLIKNQGERVSIFVSRDLSFKNVYGIKAHGNY